MQKSILSKAVISAFLYSVSFSAAAHAQSPTSCGNSVDADIVIMIDNTHSIKTDVALANEKNAAKALLGFFASAVGNSPRVAIGTFSLNKNANGCKDADCKARILPGGNLTTNYGSDSIPSTGLYAAVNSISNPGGTTDLGAAISTAQAEIAAHATASNRYIIIVTDGITSDTPDPATPGECSGGTLGAAAAAAAADAEAAGTRIFTVHFGADGTCPIGTGRTFLAQTIATSLAYYFEGNADLPGIFTKISQSIVCNDGNAATADSCNTTTHKCEYTPIIDGGGDGDGDGDGNPDGADGCAMDPYKTAPGVCGCGMLDADTNNDGVIECVDTCFGGKIDACGICGGNGSSCTGCDGVFGSNKATDLCGVCGGDGTSCLQCTTRDLTIDMQMLGKGSAKQKRAINRYVSELRKHLLPKKARKLIKKIRKESKEIFLANNTFVLQTPKSQKLCTNTTLCVNTDHSAGIALYESNARKLRKFANQLARQLSKNQGDKKVLTKHKKFATKALKRVLEVLTKVPTASSDCTH